jgi:dolichol-phosphate mannosyltransferase
MIENKRIAVVIPSYKVTAHILGVIAACGPEIDCIYVVDDCCPQGSGDFVEKANPDPRVRVLRHTVNQGVGGAMITGYRQALADGFDIAVKIDGDGQMDPALIAEFVLPIALGEADYTKGNRFFDMASLEGMPKLRVFGNAALSLLNKASSGYWNVFDPTNGYTAIHRDLIAVLPWDRVSKRYFFETDVLFRLGTFRAVVVDVPMAAKYGDEVSNLHIRQIIGEFAVKHLRNFFKRIFYSYFLRDLSAASIALPVGLLLTAFGLVFGGWHWWDAVSSQIAKPTGTVMLATLTTLLGLELLLAFVVFDVSSVPTRIFHRRRRVDPPAPAQGPQSTVAPLR